MPLMTNIDAITSSLGEEMARDENVFIIGEDVGAMGRVFKATKGLQEEFGSDRIIDSPLAEGIIISSSIGAAMAGMHPVAMTGITHARRVIWIACGACASSE